MMAYVLINTELESERKILELLRKIEDVKEANAVHGVYEIIAKVEAETVDKLNETVTFKIRMLNKVRHTLTMIITD